MYVYIEIAKIILAKQSFTQFAIRYYFTDNYSYKYL